MDEHGTKQGPKAKSNEHHPGERNNHFALTSYIFAFAGGIALFFTQMSGHWSDLPTKTVVIPLIILGASASIYEFCIMCRVKRRIAFFFGLFGGIASVIVISRVY